MNLTTYERKEDSATPIVAISITSGVVFTLLVLLIAYLIGAAAGENRLPTNLESILLILYICTGTMLLGATPAWAFLRERLVSPAIIIFGLYTVAVIRYITTPSQLPGLYAAYFVAWFIVLGLAILFGFAEYGARVAIRSETD